jgi:hypothetical protein
MKKSLLLLTSSIALALFSGSAISADRIVSQKAVSDPVADIQNLYAFMDPPCQTMGGTGCEAEPEELIVAFTVNPFASDNAQFSPDVQYRINFENDVGMTSEIECSISNEQAITCAGLNGQSVTAPVGQVGVNGNLRVFAGLRDDPGFLDLDAVNNFATAGIGAFTDPGTDFFAGSNVLAIVVGIKNASFPAGSGAVDANGHPINVQKIWVASEAISGLGISGAITGSWYNPDQSGQGWIIEVISTPSGNQFLVYFFGYADDGEQLWLLGITDDISGPSVTVDALRFNGVGFGDGFDPASLTNEVVGSMTFDFADCNNGTVTFAPSSGGLSGYTIDTQRLTSIADLDCTSSTKSLVQVDREGRPLVNGFISDGQRDAYNAASDPSAWSGLFRSEILTTLGQLDSVDGILGNSLVDPQVMADLLVDDRMRVDLAWSACPGFFGQELSDLVPQPHTNDCGGRELTYNVSDFLGFLINSFDPFITDFVDANDRPFLAGFPFLAPPN